MVSDRYFLRSVDLFELCVSGQTVLINCLALALDKRQSIVYEVLCYEVALGVYPLCRDRFFAVSDVLKVNDVMMTLSALMMIT